MAGFLFRLETADGGQIPAKRGKVCRRATSPNLMGPRQSPERGPLGRPARL
jgi:hypothetical protein